MLTIQDWLDAGYRRYDANPMNNSDCFLQKRFDDAEGKRYYIGVDVYEWDKHEYSKYNPGMPKVSFQPEVQFQRQEDITLNVTFLMNEDSTIVDIEKEVEAIWMFLGKPYYEKWEDYK